MAQSLKKRKLFNVEHTPTFIWKESPPGPEQRELERMFREKLISDTDSPYVVRSKNPVFMKFSTKVFGVHFRKTKAKFGFFSKSLNDDEHQQNAIPQLGFEHGSDRLCSNLHENADFVDSDHSDSEPMESFNPPFVTWVHTDHDKKCKFVNVAVPIISGSRDIKFEVSENGLKLYVHYTWPSAICNPKELFADDLENKNLKHRISSDHPKVHSLTSHLLASEITSKTQPKGKMCIRLPIPVQREQGTWEKKAVQKNDGTKVVLLELKSYQEKVIIDDLDTSIIFD